VHGLPWQPERLPTCRQHRQPHAAPAEALDQRNDRIEHVLAVVQEQQHRPVLDELLERLSQRELLVLLDVERGGDDGDGSLRPPHGGQLDDRHLLKPPRTGGRHSHGHPRLADATRAADGDDRAFCESLLDGRDVTGPTDQRRGLTARQRGHRCSRDAARAPQQ